MFSQGGKEKKLDPTICSNCDKPVTPSEDDEPYFADNGRDVVCLDFECKHCGERWFAYYTCDEIRITKFGSKDGEE